MNQPFFLTRQTAGLVEDIVHELNSGSGLFLVYGDRGVGKTRTLEEMTRSRLGKRKVRWIDLQAGGAGDGALVDSSAMIESVFASAKAGDVIVADHIEMAMKKTRHQLFLSWSTIGRSKKLGLVIIGISDYSTEVDALAQQYEVRLRAVHHRALDPDEALAFLGFYLYPDRPASKLDLPPLLRKQLGEARGNIGRIIEIAERAGDQISAVVPDQSRKPRRGSDIVVSVIASLLFVAGCSWYFFGADSSFDRPAPSAAEVPVFQTTEAPSTGAVEKIEPPVAEDSSLVETPAEVDPAAADAVVVELYSESALEGEAVLVAGIDEADIAEIVGGEEVEAMAGETSESAGDADEATNSPVAAETQSAGETVAAREISPVENDLRDYSVTIGDPDGKRLWRDLARSSAWIDRMDRSTGTVQFMLLNYERFDEPTYYEFIDRLQAGGVDPNSIRIFKTLTGNQESYSVVYGEFDSWQAASDAKDSLPAVLRETSPIPRSVGGLRDEIQRLEQRN